MKHHHSPSKDIKRVKIAHAPASPENSAMKSVTTVPDILTEEDPKKPMDLNSPEKVTKEKTGFHGNKY